jgi:small subunit ribosomal protein S1
VKNLTDYGAFIDLGGIDGLLHITDISWKKINHPSDILTLGSEIEVQVLKFDEELTSLSLGIKQLEEDPWDNIDEKFQVDNILNVEVTNISDQGVSVKTDENFNGFIQIQDLSWLKKPPHASKIVQVDDKLEVKLLEINKEKRRLDFGLEQLKENPWDNISKKYKVSDTFETQIVNKVDFGIFVKISDI